MDIVKDYIVKINGKINLHSKDGEGTEILIRVPLHTSINKFIVIRSGEQDFAVPEALIKELRLLEKQEIDFNDKGATFRLRDQTLPLIQLQEFLDYLQGKELSCKTSKSSSETMIIESESKLYGLSVDSIEEAMDLIIKPLDLPNIQIGSSYYQFFTGATLLNSGNPALILNIEEIIRFYDSQMIYKQQIEKHQTKSIDDYLSDRQPEGSILHFIIKEQDYGITFEDIQEAIYDHKTYAIPGLGEELLGIVNLRGESIPNKNTQSQSSSILLVIKRNGKRLAINVDEIIGLSKSYDGIKIIDSSTLIQA